MPFTKVKLSCSREDGKPVSEDETDGVEPGLSSVTSPWLGSDPPLGKTSWHCFCWC